MSELKTFRCEVCGEIYHSDEIKKNMTIFITRTDDEEGKAYQFICPTCAVTLSNVLNNPGMVDDAAIREGEMKELIRKTKNRIENLLHKMTGNYTYHFPIMWHAPNSIEAVSSILEDRFKDLEDECSKIKESMEHVTYERDKFKLSRNKWRAAFMGLAVGNLIGLLVALIF